MPAPPPNHLDPPRRVGVIGAGMVGLATAWFLQERGVDVTVLDREHVAAGSSWGNAGWLPPALTTPLPEPAVLRYGLRTALKPSSPVYVPVRADVQLARFLAGFARHCTPRAWSSAMAAYAPANRRALQAFDAITADGHVPPPAEAKPFLVAYRTEGDREEMVHELEHIRQSQPVDYDLLTGEEVRELEPSLSTGVTAGLSLHGQRFINPPVFVHALADAVLSRGGLVLEGVGVTRVSDEQSSVSVEDSTGERHCFDAVVLATGAVLGDLARPFGVRRVVQAGRGYSFSVPCRDVPSGPVYFPAQRVACTPLDTDEGPRLRVAGMMEFRAPDEPLDPRRIKAIVDSVRPLLDGVDLDDRKDEWVGSRPCTADGLPLVGATTSPRVFAAGGHGMWGIALGPLTGQLLAEQIVTGEADPILGPFDPLR